MRLQEVAKPSPGEQDVLLRNYATSVKYGDLVARNFKAISPQEFSTRALSWLLAQLSFGLNKPRTTILGNEFAGEVEAVVKAVTAFKPGDQMLATGVRAWAHAECVCMPESGVLAHKQANVSHEDAAVVLSSPRPIPDFSQ